MKSIPLIIFNVVLSIALVLVNKRIVVVENFRFMTVLTCLHFYASFIGCCIMLAFSLMKYKQVKDYSCVIRIALASLVSIVCMNYSLAYSSVGFYQIAKLFCIPVTIALEKIFGFRQQGFSLILVASLVLLCIGMALIVEQEMDTNIIGLFWTIAGVISTSVAQVFFGPLKKRLDLGALQLLFHTSPFMAVGCFVAVPLLEDTKELYSMKISSGLISMIILSCLIAVTFNNSNYMLLSEITPLTYTVLGHFKTIVIILLGIYFFDSVPSMRMLAGISAALIGVALYTYDVNFGTKRDTLSPSSDDSLRKQTSKQWKPSADDVVASHSANSSPVPNDTSSPGDSNRSRKFTANHFTFPDHGGDERRGDKAVFVDTRV